jgi:DNA repair protein SbcC/Rad50
VSAALIHEGTPDGARLLGLTRQTFLSTVCVRQADILGILEQAGGLQEQLQRAAATGGKDETAEGALQRLDTFQKERIGTDRRNSVKPLRQSLDRLERAKRELNEARYQHQAYLALVQRRDRAQDDARDALQALADARVARGRSELDAIERRLAQAQGLAAEFAAGPPGHLPDDHEEVEQVTRALVSFRDRPDEPSALTGTSADDLARELERLPAMPEGDREPDRPVLGAARRRDEAAQRLRLHDEQEPSHSELPDHGGATAGELRQAADELERRVPEIDPELEATIAAMHAPSPGAGGWPLAAWAGAAVLMVVGVVLFATGSSLAGALALAAGLLLSGLGVILRRRPSVDHGQLTQLETRLAIQVENRRQVLSRRENEERQCAAWGVEADPFTLRSLARQLDDATDLTARHATWTARRADLEDAHRTADRALRNALRARGVTSDEADEGEEGSPTDELVERYKSGCRARALLAMEAARRGPLLAQLEARREAEAATESARAARHRAEDGLRTAAQAIGIDAEGDPADLVTELEGWCTDRHTLRTEHQASTIRWERLQQLLDGADLEELETEVAERRARLGPDADRPAAGAVPSDDDLDVLEERQRKPEQGGSRARRAGGGPGARSPERRRSRGGA